MNGRRCAGAAGQASVVFRAGDLSHASLPTLPAWYLLPMSLLHRWMSTARAATLTLLAACGINPQPEPPAVVTAADGGATSATGGASGRGELGDASVDTQGMGARVVR